jgi:hypothetical protein
MPDTGAPWLLPYPSPSDLVRDAPQAFEDLASAAATSLSAVRALGLGTNVVQVAKRDAFSTSSSSFVAVTGLSASITCSSSSSKVLIVVQITHGLNAPNNNGRFRLTGGNATTYIGNAAGSRVRAVFDMTPRGTGEYHPSNEARSGVIVYLDSPGTTSAVTYGVECSTSGGTLGVNRSSDDSDSSSRVRGASSITLIEVAA